MKIIFSLKTFRFEKLNRLHYNFDTSKIESLGLKFKSLEEMFDDCIASFVEKGYLSHVVAPLNFTINQ